MPGVYASFVVVNPDGTIETMYLRDDDGAYFESECERTS